MGSKLIEDYSLQGQEPMYAIAFDLVTEKLKVHYSATSPNNAYAEVRKILTEYDFSWKQGSLYFGDGSKVDAVRTVLAIIDVSKRLPWFSSCVSDVRMLRIEYNNDLMPAVTSVAPATPPVVGVVEATV